MKKQNNLKNIKKCKDFIKAIEKMGYNLNRKSSSHEIYTKINCQSLIIVNHGYNDNLSVGVHKQLIRIIENDNNIKF